MLINRKLLAVKVSEDEVSDEKLFTKRKEIQDRFGFSEEEVKYFVFTEQMSNNAYNSNHDGINLLYKNGDLIDIAKASDQLNITALSKPVVKHFLFYPKP